MVVLARERALGALLAEHVVLLGRELGTPLLLCFPDFLHALSSPEVGNRYRPGYSRRMGRVALAAAVAAAFFVSASAAYADVVARPLEGRVVLRSAPHGAVVARLNNGRTEFGSCLFYLVRATR